MAGFDGQSEQIESSGTTGLGWVDGEGRRRAGWLDGVQPERRLNVNFRHFVGDLFSEHAHTWKQEILIGL